MHQVLDALYRQCPQPQLLLQVLQRLLAVKPEEESEEDKNNNNNNNNNKNNNKSNSTPNKKDPKITRRYIPYI